MKKSLALVLSVTMFLLGAYSATAVRAQEERRNGTRFSNRGVYLPALPIVGDDIELGAGPCHVEAVEQEWVLCKGQAISGALHPNTWRNLYNGATYTAPQAAAR